MGRVSSIENNMQTIQSRVLSVFVLRQPPQQIT